MRSMVEGLFPAASSQDETYRRLEVATHLSCRDAQDIQTPRLKPTVARSIPIGPVTHVVGYSVDLDRELHGGAIEVDDIGPDRMLPTKLQALWARFQELP